MSISLFIAFFMFWLSHHGPFRLIYMTGALKGFLSQLAICKSVLPNIHAWIVSNVVDHKLRYQKLETRQLMVSRY
jgi:hypothetical protein